MNMQKQHGIVLPVVLIFLVVMMLLGVTAIRNVTLEEKMSANVRNQNLAFQSAEQALRTCETMLQKGDTGSFKILSAGPLANGPNKGKNYWEVAANWKDASIANEVKKSGAETNLGKELVAERPRCIIEVMDKVVSTINVQDQKEQFRITARGVGGRDSAVVLLQSYLVLL